MKAILATLALLLAFAPQGAPHQLTLADQVQACNDALPVAGGDCTFHDVQGVWDHTVNLKTGVTLHVNAATVFYVTITDGSDALHTSKMGGFVCDGGCGAGFFLKTGSKVGSVVKTVPAPGDGFVANASFSGLTISGEWGTQCVAGLDLKNATDRSVVRDLTIVLPCIELWLHNAGQTSFHNLTLDEPHNSPDQKTRPIVIEDAVAPNCYYMEGLDFGGVTTLHASKGQYALEINGHGCPYIVGVTFDHLYIEPRYQQMSAILLRDARSVKIAQIGSANACDAAPCGWQDFVRVEESGAGQNLDLCVEHLLLLNSAVNVINDLPMKKQRHEGAIRRWCSDDETKGVLEKVN